MKRHAFCLLSMLGACSPGAPAPPAPVVAPAQASAPPSAEPAPVGPAVLVPQRLAEFGTVRELDPRGELLLLSALDGLHLVDVETGQSRGVLGGCANEAHFTPDGRWVVVRCGEPPRVRVWDLDTDVARDLVVPSLHDDLVTATRGSRVAITVYGGVLVVDPATAAITRLPTSDRQIPEQVALASSGGISAITGTEITTWGSLADPPRRFTRKSRPRAFSMAPSGKRAAVGEENRVTVLHLESGREEAVFTPCGALVTDLRWSDDEQHLVVACLGNMQGNPTRVVVFSPSGVEEHELVSVRSGDLKLALAGEEVGTLHNDGEGAWVHSIATGQMTDRFPPLKPSRVASAFSHDLRRVLFGRGLEELMVVDRRSGAVGPYLRASAYEAQLGGLDHNGLVVAAGGRESLLDPMTGETRRSHRHDLSPDGKTILVPSRQGGFELVDRGSGARRQSSRVELDGSPDFSLTGAFVTGIESAPSKRRDDHPPRDFLWVFDARTLVPIKPLPFGHGWRRFWWSPDDGMLAMLHNTGSTRAGAPCAAGEEKDCLAVRILDPRTGRLLSTIRPAQSVVTNEPYSPDGTHLYTFDHVNRNAVRFTHDDRHVIIRDQVYDARTGRLAWSVPKGQVVVASLYTRRELLLQAGTTLRVVDPATGKSLREIADVDAVGPVSGDGTVVLGRRQGTIWLWETATGTGRPTAIDPEVCPPPDNDPRTPVAIHLRHDGKFAFFLRGDHLAVHRFADGRTLFRNLPDASLDFTDQGVFDPPTSRDALLRRGPSVRRSPLVPLSAGEGLARPGLFADFGAGKPVGPKAPAGNP